MAFSQVLYGTGGNIIFLGFCLAGLLGMARNLDSAPLELSLIASLVAAFALVGTLGWRRVHGGQRALYLYFAVQSALVAVIFALENIASGGGASGNFALPLILQVSVLGWKPRLAVAGLLTAWMGGVSLLFLPLNAVIGGTVSLTVSHLLLLFVGHLIVSEERARQQLHEAHQRLAAYALQVDELATTRERNRLAREIHDSLGHYLTIVNVQIEVAQTVLRREPDEALAALSRAQALTKDGLAALRQSVSALRDSATLNHPLHQALLQLVEEHRDSGLNVNYRMEGAARLMPEAASLALYRVAQEGLTNIRKHAQSKHTDMALCYGSNRLVSLSIQDDGVGGSGDATGGYGLAGIQERVQSLGGKFEVETAPGQGFRLYVEIIV